MPTLSFTNKNSDTVSISFKLAMEGELHTPMMEERNANRDGNGGVEIIAGWMDWELTIPMLISEDEYNKFMGWFSYASQGYPFAISLDDNTYDSVTTLAAGCSEVAKTQIYVSSTTGIASGDRMLIRSTDRYDFEEIKVSSAALNLITTSWDLMNDYAAGSTIRHYRYHPSLFLEGMKEFKANRTNALDMTAEGYRKFSITAKEKF